jgi:hypothetical protein
MELTQVSGCWGGSGHAGAACVAAGAVVLLLVLLVLLLVLLCCSWCCCVAAGESLCELFLSKIICKLDHGFL